jgi:hypothetical protein
VKCRKRHDVVECDPDLLLVVFEDEKLLAEGVEAEAGGLGHAHSAWSGGPEQQHRDWPHLSVLSRGICSKIELTEPHGVALTGHDRFEPADRFFESVFRDEMMNAETLVDFIGSYQVGLRHVPLPAGVRPVTGGTEPVPHGGQVVRLQPVDPWPMRRLTDTVGVGDLVKTRVLTRER